MTAAARPAFVAFVALALVGTAGAGALADRPALQAGGGPTGVDGCTTITEPGRYVLSADVENADRGENFTFISQACIRIESSDVVFDGDGHTVDGFGVSDTTAIRVGGDGTLSNVTVENLAVDEWNRGIYVENVTNATVRDANVSGNALGVFLEDSTAVKLRNVTATDNFVGVYAGNVSGAFADSTLQDGEPVVVDRRTPAEATETDAIAAENATTAAETDGNGTTA